MIGIIDYGAGNLFSLQCALDRLGAEYEILSSPERFDACDRYIIPGVGNAAPAMQRLESTGLVKLVGRTNKPVLGLCLGMQMLTGFSEEGNTRLMNLIPLKTRRFSGIPHKVPQMGWNRVFPVGDSPLFEGIPPGEYFYFVHSYYVEEAPSYTIGKSTYGIDFSAAIQRENFLGAQFHPEKSGKAGGRLLRNFSAI